MPVTAKIAFLMIESFILPSSEHQLFCGRTQITILMIAEIQIIASTATGAVNSGNVSFQM